jgi:hypothetical protein
MHSHICGDTYPPHGSLQGILVGLPRDTFLLNDGHPFHSQSMLFVGEVPSLGRDWQTRPVGVAEERDWQGDLFGRTSAYVSASKLIRSHCNKSDSVCSSRIGESYCKHVSTCIHNSSSTALTDALHNEKPSPPCASIDAIEIAISRGLQVAREHGAQ